MSYPSSTNKDGTRLERINDRDRWHQQGRRTQIPNALLTLPPQAFTLPSTACYNDRRWCYVTTTQPINPVRENSEIDILASALEILSTRVGEHPGTVSKQDDICKK